MFQAIASLFILGSLSSVSPGVGPSFAAQNLTVSSPLQLASDRRIARQASASGIIVMDVESGEVIFAREADVIRSMGSLAKLMTFDVISKNHNLQDVVTVPASVRTIVGSTVGLAPGERYAVRDLLSMILMASANDAAHTLAVYHSGSEVAFAQEMNERVCALGLQKTHFRNAVGFDAEGQYSTPRELAWLAAYIWKDPLAHRLTGTRLLTVWDRSGTRAITLRNTNQLLFSHPSVFLGLKTGTTTQAGECLISIALIGDRPVVIVVLNSKDRYSDTLILFDSVSRSSA